VGGSPRAHNMPKKRARDEDVVWPQEWAPLGEAFTRAGCHLDQLDALGTNVQPLSGDIARILVSALSLHRALEAAGDGTSPPTRTAMELLPPRGAAALSAPEVLLSEQVAAASSRACQRSSKIHSSSFLQPAAAPEDAAVAGPPTRRELLPSSAELHPEAAAGEARREHAAAFRASYMELLADGAADELDALRREEPPMDEAGLANLVEALEAGSAAFSDAQRPLLSASFHGAACWWARGRSDGDTAVGRRHSRHVADAWLSSFASGDEEEVLSEEGATAAAPSLIARIQEMRRRASNAKTRVGVTREQL
jgi:hypothetical protein